METIKNFLLKLWFMFRLPILVIAIGVIVGFIFHNGLVGFFTTGGLIIILALIGAYKAIWKDK